MPARIDDISTMRPPKSALDRHAIGIAGGALTMALRLEQKIKNAADRRFNPWMDSVEADEFPADFNA